MGWLAIDTRVNGHSTVAWVDQGKVEALQIEGKASRVLPSLARLVADRRGALGGVLVAVGPGTFSSVRTGVLYANLCARLLNIPLVELSEEEANGQRFEEVIRAFQAGTHARSSYAAPIYDREPNITIPRPRP